MIQRQIGSGAGGDGELSVADLDNDVLVDCFRRLSVRQLASVALSCRRLRDVAYQSPVWEHQCRLAWPEKEMAGGRVFQYCGGRDAFVARHVAGQQLRFHDPEQQQWQGDRCSVSHLEFGPEDGCVTAVQGAAIAVWRLGKEGGEGCPPWREQLLEGHTARITCLRSVPGAGISSGRGGCEKSPGGNVLISASADRTIRVWGKTSCRRMLQGHAGPVVALSDKLLGQEGGPPVLASAGDDATVRLWSLGSGAAGGGTRGKSSRPVTLRGHEGAISALAVAGHNPSLLLSAGKYDGKVRVWDACVASSSSGGCLGSVKLADHVGHLACSGAMCYATRGSGVAAIDVRLMREVAAVAAHRAGTAVHSLAVSWPAMCTGGASAAKLWDVRVIADSRPVPMAVLGDDEGAVSALHLDNHKVVTGTPLQPHVRVWEAGTGRGISALQAGPDGDVPPPNCGVSALTVRGARVLIGTCGGWLSWRDYSNCIEPLETETEEEDESGQQSRFWQRGPSGSDDEDCKLVE